MKEFAACLQRLACPGDAIFTRTARYNCFAGCISLSLTFADGGKGTTKAEVQDGSQIGGVSRGWGSRVQEQNERAPHAHALSPELVGTTVFSSALCKEWTVVTLILCCQFNAGLPAVFAFHVDHLSQKIKKLVYLESGPLPLYLAFTAVDSNINQFLLYTDRSECISLYLHRNRKEKKKMNCRPNKAGLLQHRWRLR